MRLKVSIERAAGLPSADFNGKSDPYVKFYWNGVKYKTEVIKKSLNPEWRQSFEIDFDRDTDATDLKFEIFDWDLLGRNDPLGTVTVDLGGLYVNGPPVRGAFQVQPVPDVDLSGMGLLYLSIQVIGGDPFREGQSSVDPHRMTQGEAPVFFSSDVHNLPRMPRPLESARPLEQFPLPRAPSLTTAASSSSCCGVTPPPPQTPFAEASSASCCLPLSEEPDPNSAYST